MRYRIPLVLAGVMAVIGLSAPAALASAPLASTDQLPPANTACSVGTTYGPYHIMTNDNNSVGITYHGAVNQATVTTSPGDSRLEVAQCVGGSPIYVIHNAAGNCLRMHDASSGFGVYEQNGCDLSNTEEQFALEQGSNSSLYTFENIGWGLWLGVNCPATNNEGVIGVQNAPGNCLNWQLQTP
jgi:hypothetical protein